MFGQPVGLPVPRVVGCRLVGAPRAGRDVHRHRARADPIPAQRRRAGGGGRILRAGAGASVAARPRDDRQHGGRSTAPRWDSSRWTPRRCAICARPAARRRRSTLVERYTQGAGAVARRRSRAFQTVLEFDLGGVEPSLAGPSRPESLVPLADVAAAVPHRVCGPRHGRRPRRRRSRRRAAVAAWRHRDRVDRVLHQHGEPVSDDRGRAARAQRGREGVCAPSRGSRRRSRPARAWSRRCWSEGGAVATRSMRSAFNLVGFGCMSCGSGSGALAEEVAAEIAARDLVAAGVISSNRNFEGRLNASVRGTFLASPPLVVAYAIAGSILHDLTREQLGDDSGRPPGVPRRHLAGRRGDPRRARPRADRAICFATPTTTSPIPVRSGREIPLWRRSRRSPGMPPACTCADRRSSTTAMDAAAPIVGARMLLMLGDDVTTDHISPGGAIPPNTDAGDLSHRAWRAAAEIRHLYRPPREPRGDDPRHVREHPPAQRARAGPRRRIHPPSAERRDA